jgi:hypothetical protein
MANRLELRVKRTCEKAAISVGAYFGSDYRQVRPYDQERCHHDIVAMGDAFLSCHGYRAPDRSRRIIEGTSHE